MITIAGFVLLIVVYRDTFLSMVAKWTDDSAFNYGYVIAPISAWLAWRSRDEMAQRLPLWLKLGRRPASRFRGNVGHTLQIFVINRLIDSALIPSP